MAEWNRAQLLGHLIRVVTKSDTLWALWVNGTVPRGKHFWVTNIPTDCSWIWRQVLKLRNVALQFFSFNIANGDSISLWFDPWWQNSCLATSHTSSIITQCGLHHNDKLSKIIHDGVWILPTANPRQHHIDPLLQYWLTTFEPPTLVSGVDTILWDGINVKKIKTWHI